MCYFFQKENTVVKMEKRISLIFTHCGTNDYSIVEKF